MAWHGIDVGFFQRRCHDLRISRNWQDKRRSGAVEGRPLREVPLREVPLSHRFTLEQLFRSSQLHIRTYIHVYIHSVQIMCLSMNTYIIQMLLYIYTSIDLYIIYTHGNIYIDACYIHILIHSATFPCNSRRDGQSSNASGDWSGILEPPGKPHGSVLGVFLARHMWSMHLKPICVDIYILFVYIKNDESIHFYEEKPTTTVAVCWHDPI